MSSAADRLQLKPSSPPTPQSADHMAPKALLVSGVSVRFGGVVALDDVSLTVSPNEVVGIIGPNGAGKTSLFNAICRLVAIQRGTITYGEQSLLDLRAPRLAGLGVARTLQGLGYWPRMSVLDNVVMGAPSRTQLFADMLATPRAEARASARSREAMILLDELGIADRAGSLPSVIPYGAQKRMVIARALMSHPTLLLLDEPASGLAANEVDELVQLLRRLRDDMSILLVEHHLDMVMAASDRITVLNLGRVIASGTPGEIRANPAVAVAYLGEQAANA